MKDKIWMGLCVSFTVAFLLFWLTCIGQALVDMARWVNYRSEVQQIRLEKERTELETMKARLERIKEGAE